MVPVLPFSQVWAEPHDLLLTDRIWRKWWNVISKIRFWEDSSGFCFAYCLSLFGPLGQKYHGTGWLMESRNVLLTVLEAGRPRSGCQHGGVLVRAFFWVADCWLLVCPHTAVGARELFQWLSCPPPPSHSWWLYLHDLIAFQRPNLLSQLLRPSSWGLGFNTWILGATNIQSIALNVLSLHLWFSPSWRGCDAVSKQPFVVADVASIGVSGHSQWGSLEADPSLVEFWDDFKP